MIQDVEAHRNYPTSNRGEFKIGVVVEEMKGQISLMKVAKLSGDDEEYRSSFYVLCLKFHKFYYYMGPSWLKTQNFVSASEIMMLYRFVELADVFDPNLGIIGEENVSEIESKLRLLCLGW